jgi:hypothetical protein
VAEVHSLVLFEFSTKPLLRASQIAYPAFHTHVVGPCQGQLYLAASVSSRLPRHLGRLARENGVALDRPHPAREVSDGR